MARQRQRVVCRASWPPPDRLQSLGEGPVATLSIEGPIASCPDFLQNPQQNQDSRDKETLVLHLPPQTSPFLVA